MNMKNYEEMTMDEIRKIINRGGDDLVKLNGMVQEYLFSISTKLSDKANQVITTTDGHIMAECFGGLFEAEDIEEYIKDTYQD